MAETLTATISIKGVAKDLTRATQEAKRDLIEIERQAAKTGDAVETTFSEGLAGGMSAITEKQSKLIDSFKRLERTGVSAIKNLANALKNLQSVAAATVSVQGGGGAGGATGGGGAGGGATNVPGALLTPGGGGGGAATGAGATRGTFGLRRGHIAALLAGAGVGALLGRMRAGEQALQMVARPAAAAVGAGVPLGLYGYAGAGYTAPEMARMGVTGARAGAVTGMRGPGAYDYLTGRMGGQRAGRFERGARAGARRETRAMAMTARVFGVEPDQIAEMIGGQRRRGAGGFQGAQQRLERLFAAGVASGLSKARVPELLEGANQLSEKMFSEDPTRDAMEDIGRQLANLGAANERLAGRYGTEYLGRIGQAIMGAKGAAQGLILRAFGFGQGTGYYEARMRQAQGVGRAENLPAILRRVQKEYGAGEEGGLSKIGVLAGAQMTGLSPIAFREIAKAVLQGTGTRDEKKAEVQKILDSEKERVVTNKTLNQSLRGVHGALSRQVQALDRSVAQGKAQETLTNDLNNALNNLAKAIRGATELLKQLREGLPRWLGGKGTKEQAPAAGATAPMGAAGAPVGMGAGQQERVARSGQLQQALMRVRSQSFFTQQEQQLQTLKAVQPFLPPLHQLAGQPEAATRGGRYEAKAAREFVKTLKDYLSTERGEGRSTADVIKNLQVELKLEGPADIAALVKRARASAKMK